MPTRRQIFIAGHGLALSGAARAQPPMPWTRGPALVHEGSNTMWHMLTVAAPERGMAIADGSGSQGGVGSGTWTGKRP